MSIASSILTVSKPTLVFDVTQAKAYAAQLRAGNQQTSRQVDQAEPVPESSNIRMRGSSGFGAKRTLQLRDGSLDAAIEHTLTAQREDTAILE